MQERMDSSSAVIACDMPVTTALRASAFCGGSYRSSSESTRRTFASRSRLSPRGSDRPSTAAFATRFAAAYSIPMDSSFCVISGDVSLSWRIRIDMPSFRDSAFSVIGNTLAIATNPRATQYVFIGHPLAGAIVRERQLSIIATTEPTTQPKLDGIIAIPKRLQRNELRWATGPDSMAGTAGNPCRQPKSTVHAFSFQSQPRRVLE